MKYLTTAAGLLLTASVVTLLVVSVESPTSAFGDAVKQMREARSMSYTEVLEIKGNPRPIIIKNFIADDGRKRTEHKGGLVTIFDASGHIRLSLIGPTNTALVYERADEQRDNDAFKPFLRRSRMLKELSDKPDKELGEKVLDGKRVKGYVTTRGGSTYTMWVDSQSRQPVLVEYDLAGGAAGRVTMKDFRFDEPQDESLFSFAAPPGYKVRVTGSGRPADGKEVTTEGLELAWSRDGHWGGVTGAVGEAAVYALQGERVVKLDENGEELSATILGNRARILRTANLDGDQEPEFVTFARPLSAVTAHRTDGTLLWSYNAGLGVNDVCAADLDGDGLDEVIIGYGGFTGLHVLAHTGDLLWKKNRMNNSIGNVWHVTTGHVRGGTQTQVVTTSSGGKVHVFDAAGERLRDLSPGFYTNMVRTWQPAVGDKAMIVAAGTSQAKTTIAALFLPGEVRWSRELAARVADAATCSQRPWVALTLNDGSVRVIDLLAGKEIARVGGQGRLAEVAWLPAGERGPLLVVGSPGGLHAYRVTAQQQ